MADGRREPRRGQRLHGAAGRRIGTVDAVYADYVLVRTGGLLPVDLYVPRSEVTTDVEGRLRVEATAAAAYEAWHRPLKRVTHG
jgi:hypothetical protein